MCCDYSGCNCWLVGYYQSCTLVKMECTQRLEYTQELYESRSERICPEQIGFLGICGVKYPVKRGPNKIGRDPQTCSIVLNLNSISRQHAVINVLNQTEFMLMDLDSANKTKLMDKTIPPYIPHSLKHGDMVQFGDIFGIFRLFEEDTDLPMTQAIDMPETQIPETPIANRHVSKMNKFPTTTIPESPDVSDKDDSFIVPSQPKCFRNSNSHFVKPSAKLISIQPVGTNKIDNIYWNSSKKSVSLNLQLNDSDNNLNNSILSDKTTARQSNYIYERETEAPAPCEADESTDSIYTANTQVPPAIHNAHTQALTSIQAASTQDLNSIQTANTHASTAIHNANTQVPISLHNASTQEQALIHIENTQASCATTSIHSINTQLPSSTNLPEECNINNQREVRFDLCNSRNKQNNNNIFDAETQLCTIEDEQHIKLNKITCKSDDLKEKTSKKLNLSAEEVLFEELVCQDFDNDIESQPLLPPENVVDIKEDTSNEIQVTKQSKNVTNKNNPKIENRKNEVIIHSDSSTDCEDIDLLPTQKITEKQADDEDATDCEDLFDDVPIKPIENLTSSKKTENESFENMLTQVICEENVNNDVSSVNKTTHAVNFEDMPTQVIDPDVDEKPFKSRIQLEDMPTQIIVDNFEEVIIADKPIASKNTSFEDPPTQVKSEKSTQNNVSKVFDSPFKIPLLSPLKARRKDIKIITPKSKPVQNKVTPIVLSDDDDNYYAATQDIFNDLCTQPDILPNNVIKDNVVPLNNIDDDFLPSSVEDYKVGIKFPHLENNLSPKNKHLNKSFESSDGDEDVNKFVSKMSIQEIRDVIGVEPQVDKVKRVPSDISDVELTPKKLCPIKFLDIDLPNSQEIKTSLSMYAKTPVTESSSESEVESDSQECTPILFRKNKKPKLNAKMDLTKVFAAEALPTRVMTRVRKPTNKYQNEGAKNFARNILRPKFLTEQEDEIDKEIITENISRLQNRREKSKNKEANKVSGSEKYKASKVKNESKLDHKKNANESKKVDIAENYKQNINCAKADKVTIKDDDSDTVKTITEADKPKEKSKSNKTNEKLTKRDSNRSSNNKNLTTDTDVPNTVSPKDTKDSQNTNGPSETSSDLISTRSTRNRRKVTKTKEKQSPSVQEDSQSEKTDKPSRMQSEKKSMKIDLTEELVTFTRSRRQQKPTLEKIESQKKTVKRETKSLEKADSDKTAKLAAKKGKPVKNTRTAKAEQSTVFSLSTDSVTDSPKSILKRPASDILEPPNPKRTRSAVNSGTSRATPARMNKTHHVLFTAFPCEEVKAKLEKLGAVIVTDVSACSVVLTLAVKRTFKLLCAVGLGRPIVGPAWVQACADTNTLVDPWLYILKDEVAEKRFQFSLEKTLLGKRNFLSGFHLSSTPRVMPNTDEMKLIVECSGGTWKEEGPQWICVSCSADKPLWPALKRKGAIVVSTEFILGGVLRQRADITKNKL